MVDVARDFWVQVLGALEPQLKRSDFLTWFQHSALLERQASKVIIGFPTVLTRDWVVNKYHAKILEALKVCDANIETVIYEVDGTLSNPEHNLSIDIKILSKLKLPYNGITMLISGSFTINS